MKLGFDVLNEDVFIFRLMEHNYRTASKGRFLPAYSQFWSKARLPFIRFLKWWILNSILYFRVHFRWWTDSFQSRSMSLPSACCDDKLPWSLLCYLERSDPSTLKALRFPPLQQNGISYQYSPLCSMATVSSLVYLREDSCDEGKIGFYWFLHLF